MLIQAAHLFVVVIVLVPRITTALITPIVVVTAGAIITSWNHCLDYILNALCSRIAYVAEDTEKSCHCVLKGMKRVEI